MGRMVALLWMILAGAVAAADIPEGMADAQVVVLGEVHDNPHAHARQAELVAALKPGALVFEMLTDAQAAAVTPDVRGDAVALEAALGWEAAGWPDFEMYYPIFAAAPQAGVYGGAVPRGEARAAMEAGVAEWFGAGAARYGLGEALDPDQQEMREEMQHLAHCEALPAEMLPVMVELQRLRDAVLARAVMAALEETGGPVAVITGNGHARRDWGVPAFVARAAPDVSVFSLAIAEPGGADGVFDAIEEVPAAEREDPCAAFDKG